MYHSFLIHSSADGHLGCFYVLAIINSAVMNIGLHVSVSILVSSVCMPSSGTAGSYGSSISIAVPKTSRTMFNSSSESGHRCLVPDFRGNAFNFSPLRIMFVCIPLH